MSNSTEQFKKTWRNFLIFLFVNAAFAFFLVFNAPGIVQIKNEAPLILFVFLLTYVIGMNVWFYQIWRCPACKKMLPFAFKKPTSCPSCKSQLS